MTIEQPMRVWINARIAECNVEGAAIWDRMEAVETWRSRATRPLDAHRAIKALQRDTGHPSEEICALFIMAAAVKVALGVESATSNNRMP
jgi:uncharacterized protein (DUF2384 family)